MNRQRQAFVWMCGMHFANDGLQTALLLLLPLMADKSGLGLAAVGGLSAVHFLVGVVLATPIAALTGRFESRTILVAGLGVSGACFCVLPIVTNPFQLGVVYVLAGGAFAAFHPLAFAELAATTDNASRGGRIATFTAVGDVGRCALATLTTMALVHVAWQNYAALLGALILAVLFGTWCVSLRRTPIRARRCGGNRQKPGSWGTVVRLLRESASFRAVCALGFFDALANSALYVFVPVLLTQAGLTSSVVAVLVSTFFVASLLGKCVGGRLADRLGFGRSLVWSQAGCAAVLLLLAMASWPVSVAILIVILGALSKASLPIILSMTAQSLTPATMRIGFGVNQTMLGTASALSPLFLGLCAENLGVAEAFGFAGGVCMVTTLLAAVTMRDLCQNVACSQESRQPATSQPRTLATSTAV